MNNFGNFEVYGAWSLMTTDARRTLTAANSLRVFELRLGLTTVRPFDTVYQHKVHHASCLQMAPAVWVVGAGEFDHATPVLRDDLHWLPVPQRIQFKVTLIAFEF